MHSKPISNQLRRKLYSVKYNKRRRATASVPEEDYDAYGMENGSGYEPDYSPSMMQSLGGGAYYNEINPNHNGGYQQSGPHSSSSYARQAYSSDPRHSRSRSPSSSNKRRRNGRH